jgi:DNA-directed RNA polymerase sigma subunit (sigma70/sigma32)
LGRWDEWDDRSSSAAGLATREAVVESPIALYESGLRAISDVCADPWFSEQLAAARTGDESARQRIARSCLLRVLKIAKQEWQPGGTLGLLDLVREGNTVLGRTIEEFEDNAADAFLRELTQRVETRLTLVMEHPEMPS